MTRAQQCDEPCETGNAVGAAGCRLSRVCMVRLNWAVLAFPTGISDSASWKRGAQKKKTLPPKAQTPETPKP